ncbi:unnamed protein product [Enterobius vermicularis]|uniref:MFS domain-containing protein n=1 Tax=Enterobius vermicularis TaxID=51028 RepID=A0A0N4VKN8_ENTVE|nr:unnamed protein product [Enterobius vermicularis]
MSKLRRGQTSIWSVIVAVFSIGAMAGSFLVSFLTARVGRKRGLYVAYAVLLFGAALAIISYHVCSYELHVVARIVLGIGTGLSLGTGSILLNESSYLMIKGREDEARKAILFFHSCKIGAVDAVMNEIKENLKLCSKMQSLISVFKEKYSRHGVLVGVVIAATACFTGNTVINAFAVEILKNVGLPTTAAYFGNIGLVAVIVVGHVLSSVIVDLFGRRPLALTSSITIVFLNIISVILMHCFQVYGHLSLGYALVAVIAVFQLFFSIGVGPMCFFIGSEVVSPTARGASQSFALFSQMLSRTVILAIYWPIAEAIGQALTYFILFVIPMIASSIYLYFNLPECKNKTFKEVSCTVIFKI